jgi:hypothetical protein
MGQLYLGVPGRASLAAGPIWNQKSIPGSAPINNQSGAGSARPPLSGDQYSGVDFIYGQPAWQLLAHKCAWIKFNSAGEPLGAGIIKTKIIEEYLWKKVSLLDGCKPTETIEFIYNNRGLRGI